MYIPYTHTHIHVYIYIYIYTYIHTHIYRVLRRTAFVFELVYAQSPY